MGKGGGERGVYPPRTAMTIDSDPPLKGPKPLSPSEICLIPLPSADPAPTYGGNGPRRPDMDRTSDARKIEGREGVTHFKFP